MENKLKEEIDKRYGNFELSHDKNKIIVEDIEKFIIQTSTSFAEWLANEKYKLKFLNYWEANNFSKSPYTTQELFEKFSNEYK